MDKSINELAQANLIKPDDLFVLEQSGEAKSLSGATLKEWLRRFGLHGDTPVLTGVNIEYTIGPNGSTPPKTGWQSSVPNVPQAYYLWTRFSFTWDNTEPSPFIYFSARSGLDGTGSVRSVSDLQPDSKGNVDLSGFFDEIVESATSGIWQYIKYKSGKCICYAEYSLGNVTLKNEGWWGEWSSSPGGVGKQPYPFPIYNGKQFVTLLAGTRSPIALPFNNHTETDTGDFILVYPNDVSESPYRIDVLVIGEWQ